MHLVMTMSTRCLTVSGYDVHRFYDTDRDSEWYKVDLPTAIAAIGTVKAGRNTLTAAEMSSQTQGCAVLEHTAAGPKIPAITLREEQERCVHKTQGVFSRGDRMLWDCKMRFGMRIVG